MLTWFMDQGNSDFSSWPSVFPNNYVMTMYYFYNQKKHLILLISKVLAQMPPPSGLTVARSP